MYSLMLVFYLVGIIALAISPWVLTYWAYQDESDWRWRESLSFYRWLCENKHFAWLSTAISFVAFMGLMVHP